MPWTPRKHDSIREPFGAFAQADVAPMRARMRAAAEAELAGAATAIFCSEHCHSRLTTAGEVAALQAFLGGVLRRGAHRGLPAAPGPGGAQPLFHAAEERRRGAARSCRAPTGTIPSSTTTARWRSGRRLSGADAMQVRLFDRETLVGGSVVDDFVAAWQLGPIEGFAPVADQNESIRPAAQEFLRAVNPLLEPIPGLPIEEVRGPLAARLALLFPGRGARPARAEVEAFYGQFRASNERLRQRFFPERARLFDEDFSAYPETEDNREAGVADFAAIAARLHLAAVAEVAPAGGGDRHSRGAAALGAERAGGGGAGAAPGAALVPRPRRGAPHPGRVPAAARPPGRRDRHRRAGRRAEPRGLRVPAFPRHPVAPRRRLRRGGDGAGACAGAEPGPHGVAPRARAGADPPGRCRGPGRWPPRNRTERPHGHRPLHPDRRRRRGAGGRRPSPRRAALHRRLVDPLAHRVPDLDRLARAARRLPRRRRLLQPRRREPQQRPLRPLLLGCERGHHRRARASDRLADHLAHRLLPGSARLGPRHAGRGGRGRSRAGAPLPDELPDHELRARRLGRAGGLRQGRA